MSTLNSNSIYYCYNHAYQISSPMQFYATMLLKWARHKAILLLCRYLISIKALHIPKDRFPVSIKTFNLNETISNSPKINFFKYSQDIVKKKIT